MHSYNKLMLVAGTLTAMALAQIGVADGGDLDPTFGDGGIVLTDFFGPNEERHGTAVTTQPDGKIVAAATTGSAGTMDFAVARYHADGQPDLDFGAAGTGTVVTQFGVTVITRAVAVGGDGSIVVAGETRGGERDLALARYLADGTPDPGFGTDGIIVDDFGYRYEVARAVAIDDQDRIVVAGTVAGTGDFALVRYTPGGNRDTSFGSGGLLLIDLGIGASETAYAVTIDDTGAILVAGTVYQSGNRDFGVARYTPGIGLAWSVIEDFGTSEDRAFGIGLLGDRVIVGGRARFDFAVVAYDLTTGVRLWATAADNGTSLVGEAMSVLSDGTIVVCGDSSTGPVVCAFRDDGTVDSSFGSAGWYVDDALDDATSVTGRLGGGIVLAGWVASSLPPYSDVALRALTTSGAVDGSFGGGELVRTDFPGPDTNVATDIVALQPDGKLVVVGRTDRYWSSGGNFALARYLPDGSLDPDFGDAGQTVTDLGGSDIANAVAIDDAGRIVVAGQTDANGFDAFALARYGPDGHLDAGFGTGGVATIEFPGGGGYGATISAQAVAIDATGAIVVVGYAVGELALARYVPGSGLDWKTTTDVSPYPDRAWGVAIQDDGKILVAGSGGWLFTVARYDGTGQLDPTYGGSGVVATAFPDTYGGTAYGIALDADGNAVVCGEVSSPDRDFRHDFAVARYDPAGYLDPAFGTGGMAPTNFGTGSYDQAFDVVIQRSGMIVLAGEAANHVALARYEPDGTLDTYFGNGGIVKTPLGLAYSSAQAVTVDASDRIVAAGYAQPVGTGYDFAILRYDGSTANMAPTADAGPGQSIHAGQTVTLDGRQSWDDNTATENLLFNWYFLDRPAGSTAALAGAETAQPTFEADRPGTYEIVLVVRDDAGLWSVPDRVTVSSLNLPPTADAGDDIGGVVGFDVEFDGSNSSDPDGDPLTWTWTVVEAPPGSLAGLEYPSLAQPVLVPDLPGEYTLRLVVSDGFEDSAPDDVMVLVITTIQCAQNATLMALDLVANLPLDDVTTKGNRRALGNFLTQALRAIENGDLETARMKLSKALERADGCVERGAPDGDGPGRDWVVSCDAQLDLYLLLDAALDCLGV